MKRKNCESFDPDAEEQYRDAIEFYSLLDREVAARFRSYVAMDGIREEIGFDSFDDLAQMLWDTEEKTPTTCSVDSSHKVVHYGYDRHGAQRYRCMDCKRTFTDKSQSIIANTKKPIEAWFTFIDCMYNMRPIKETEELCGVSSTAQMNWRKRFFYFLNEVQKDISLSGEIVADETYIPSNYKGNVDTLEIAKRAPRARGKQNTRENYQRNQVCIVCALDNHGHSFSRLAGFGPPSKDRMLNVFRDKINDESEEPCVLITDGSKSYSKVVEAFNMEWHRKVSRKIGKSKHIPDTTGKYNIQSINAYHRRLKKFLNQCQGVSTRYLPGYLKVFDWKENNKGRDKKELYLETLTAMAAIKMGATDEEISQQFDPFIYEDQIRETRKAKIPVWQRKLYLDYNGGGYTPKALMEKYPQLKSRKQISSIVDKIRRQGLHQEVIYSVEDLIYNEQYPVCRIDPASMPQHVEGVHKTLAEYRKQGYQIYKELRGGMTYKEASIKYHMTHAGLAYWINKFDRSPYKIPKKKKARPNKGQALEKRRYERKQQIIRTFLFFRSTNPGASYLKMFELAAAELGCSPTRVRNVVYEFWSTLPKKHRLREENAHLMERKKLGSFGDVAMVKITERNTTIMADYLKRRAKSDGTGFVKKEIAAQIAKEYKLSYNTICALIYTYRNAGYTTIESLADVQNKEPQNNSIRFPHFLEFWRAVQPVLDGEETAIQCIKRMGISQSTYLKYMRVMRMIMETTKNNEELALLQEKYAQTV